MHIPVLYQEILKYLQPRPGGSYIDGTVGAGGHTKGLLLASAPNGRILAFDKDPEAIIIARQQLPEAGKRIIFVHASYASMVDKAPLYGFQRVDGILLDLGLSSLQLESANRGFSFMRDGPLDMRFDPSEGPTAADLLNELDAAEISTILWRYGEVRQSRRIAQAITNERPITSTGQLAELVARESTRSRSKRGRRGSRIHPATQVFQALRIAVNEELDELESGLEAAVTLLKTGGRLAVISFHSLEDRLVKQFIRERSRECNCPPHQPICTCDVQPTLRPVTRKVVRPSVTEIENNPRSRSAKLRVAERLAGEIL
jgi:16S rRNA (cytosine1402-N4)-methyltransferase